MKRRSFLTTAGLGAAALGLPACIPGLRRRSRPSNIIYILADDLGCAELGCYGQTKIRTPHLDRMAAEGIRLTQHYSGSPVCAPSRCSLLTGKHMGHAFIRDNDEMGERGDVWHDLTLEGQRPLPADTVTLAALLRSAGYATGAVGKWGLGGPASEGHPNRQGFDFWYGYLCQRIAHNYYPSYLWRNGEKEILAGNPYFYPHQKLPPDRDPLDAASYRDYAGARYSPDLMAREALAFIRANRSRPFFLYLPFTVPHAALQVPEDSLAEYEGVFPETPYLGEKGYLPHRAPRAAYAAMITRMDREIGRILALLAELGLDRRTIVFFASDNGPTFNGGTDSAFFESTGPLRGLKASLYEGGIRVPLIVRWPGAVSPGRVSSHPSAFWDVLATCGEIAGFAPPADTDGISFLPLLRGDEAGQRAHEYLYWEYAGGQAVRRGDWKALRRKPGQPVELYSLGEDPGEGTDLSDRSPDVVAEMEAIMAAARTESALFPLDR